MSADIEREVWFECSHSTGAGGQHINKNLTRVTVCFSIDRSACFTPVQKAILRKKLFRRISGDGVLRVVDQNSRSQLTNKRESVRKLLELLAEALIRQKVRVKTKATLASKQRRLNHKKNRSAVKSARRKCSEY